MADSKSGCTCLNIIGGLFILAVVAGAWRTCQAPTTATNTVPEQQQEPKLTPHERRLAVLKEKREGLAISLEAQREMANKLIRDAEKMSRDPLPDPDERQYLMESMDKVERRVDELAAQMKETDIEIAKEQGKSVGDSTPPTDSVPAQQEPEGESPPNQ